MFLNILNTVLRKSTNILFTCFKIISSILLGEYSLTCSTDLLGKLEKLFRLFRLFFCHYSLHHKKTKTTKTKKKKKQKKTCPNHPLGEIQLYSVRRCRTPTQLYPWWHLYLTSSFPSNNAPAVRLAWVSNLHQPISMLSTSSKSILIALIDL